jgi:hypothetical protein
VEKVVLPILSAAEHEFGQALSRISLDDMARHAEGLNGKSGAGATPEARSRSGLFRRDSR